MTLIRAISAMLLAIAAFMITQTANAGELIHVPLRNARIDVEGTYLRIATSDAFSRRELYGGLAAEMKEDLWTLQLEHFINQHPELDQEQRCLRETGRT